MTSKEVVERLFKYYNHYIKDKEYLFLDVESEEWKAIFKDLEVLELIKTKAQNNRFFRGCLLRMFVEIKKTPDGAFMKKEKIKDENYEKIVRWLDNGKD